MRVSGYLCAHMYTRVCIAWVRVHVRAGVTAGRDQGRELQGITLVLCGHLLCVAN